MLSPKGVGGIATFAETLSQNWNLDSYQLRLIRVPRNTFKGRLSYPFVLLHFFIVISLPSSVLLHINVASKGSPVRKLPFAFVAKAFGKPVVLHIHSGQIHEDLQAPSMGKVWKQIVQNLFKLSAGALFINREQLDYFVREKFLQRQNSGFLPNHTKMLDFQVDKQKTVDLIFVGRFSYEKGGLDFYRALLGLDFTTPIFVKVVGANMLERELKLEPALPECINLEFLGELDHGSTLKMIETSKVLVLPSHSENYPMVILEAFSLGVPVICSNVGSIPEMIGPDRGIIVEKKATKQLTEALKFYLLNPEVALVHGQTARAYVSKDLNIYDYPRKLVEAIKEIQAL